MTAAGAPGRCGLGPETLQEKGWMAVYYLARGTQTQPLQVRGQTLSPHLPRKEPQSQFPTRGPHPGPAPSQDPSVQVCSSSSLGIRVFSPSPPASRVSGVQRLNLSLPSQVLGAQIHNLHFPGIPEVSFQSGVQLETPPTRDPEPQSSSPRTKFLLGEVLLIPIP